MLMRVLMVTTRVTAGHDGQFGLALLQGESSGVLQMQIWENKAI